ncbi:unnamed protein product [Didymodactylos carnosus]|uniref:Amidase domain-containing protein n=1 Tax=Didymodactylos carnosus TaxID=1234261 RepID=A0A815BBK8_9BILA|nr:unnamed protein product [Didymodactylos carnosus]CAF4057716.1 unnamed protein product [Didymodactylos carnosus]
MNQVKFGNSSLAAQIGIKFQSDAEITVWSKLLVDNLAAFDGLAKLPDTYQTKLPCSNDPNYNNRKYTIPSVEEDKNNVWFVRTHIILYPELANVDSDTPELPLLNKRITLTDNICLKDVPMLNGTSFMEGCICDENATIVTRLLKAGAIIVGKANCEYMCISGGSHTNKSGYVQNPHASGYMSGGSSSGSAVLLGDPAAQVDMAIGCDQVPYTGIMSLESTVDYAGPCTKNVVDNCKLLQVSQGYDGFDPRSRSYANDYTLEKTNYLKVIRLGIKGRKIGLVREGFELPNAETDVNELVRTTAKRLIEYGAAVVEEITIPEHKLGPILLTGVAREGSMMSILHNSGPSSLNGKFHTSLLDYTKETMVAASHE